MQLVKRRSVRLKGLQKSTPVTEVIPDPPLPPIAAAEPWGRSGFRRRTLLLVAVAVLVTGLVAFLVLGRGNSGEGHKRSPAVPIRANSVLVLDASTGMRLNDLPLTSTPGPVTYGEGSVWVATPDEHTVSTIDPQTLNVTRFGVGLEPSGLAVGEGALWVAGFAGSKGGSSRQEELLRIQPGSHEVTSSLRIARRSDEFPIVVAAGLGSAWVGHRSELALVQVDSGGKRVLAEIHDVDPAGIALLDGSVWVADYSGSAVARIDASTRTVTPIPMGFPIASIASGEGAIWVGAGQTARDQVWQILPSSNSVRRSFGVGPGVGSIAAGDGSIWVASSGLGLSPSISRIDTQTLTVTTAMIPRPPQGIAVGAGRVWVTLG
jgi:DNA-binding beta-propeller fold protein YncE